MNAARAVEEIPVLDHDEAMTLAEAEYARLLALADGLSPQDWRRPTDCTGWDVWDVVGHLLGMVELQNCDGRSASPPSGPGCRAGCGSPS